MNIVRLEPLDLRKSLHQVFCQFPLVAASILNHCSRGRTCDLRRPKWILVLIDDYRAFDIAFLPAHASIGSVTMPKPTDAETAVDN